MISLNLYFINPINNNKDYLVINYPDINLNNWKSTITYKNDYDLGCILTNKLKDLDCSRECNGMRICSTTFFKYKSYLESYYYYLNKINNPFIYNFFIDKLIQVHQDNLLFEYNNPIIPKTINKSKVTKKKFANKYYKFVTKDLFTNKKTYRYENPHTKDVIFSDNPNLLDELNKPKERKRRTKVKGVPMEAMTFKF